jgi:hypothetical protein
MIIAATKISDSTFVYFEIVGVGLLLLGAYFRWSLSPARMSTPQSKTRISKVTAKFGDGVLRSPANLGGGIAYIQLVGTWFVIVAPIFYLAWHAKQSHWSTHLIYAIVAAIFLFGPLTCFVVIGRTIWTSGKPLWLVPKKFRT